MSSQGRARPGLSLMAGDVSARRYFAVEGAAEILAHYPPELMRSYECFVRTTELLNRIGVSTPRVLALDPGCSWMVTSHVGNLQLSAQDEEGLLAFGFEAAVEAACRIEALDPAEVASLSPALERELLTREMRQSCRVFFRKQLAPKVAAELEAVLYALCRRLGEGPLLPAHRDFMARNLMIAGAASGSVGAELVVLDHQDLRLAPLGYDLASLFFDSCPLARSRAETWVEECSRGDQHREAITRCTAQRCLKIVGTFVSFSKRGARRYLPMVPGALERAAEALAALPEGTSAAVEILRELGAERRSA